MPTLFIASPLEAGQAARLASLDPRLSVIYEPDLLPVPLFPGDHSGEAVHPHAGAAGKVATAPGRGRHPLGRARA